MCQSTPGGGYDTLQQPVCSVLSESSASPSLLVITVITIITITLAKAKTNPNPNKTVCLGKVEFMNFKRREMTHPCESVSSIWCLGSKSYYFQALTWKYLNMNQLFQMIRLKYYHLVSAFNHRIKSKTSETDKKLLSLDPRAHSCCPLLNCNYAVHQVFPAYEDRWLTLRPRPWLGCESHQVPSPDESHDSLLPVPWNYDSKN